MIDVATALTTIREFASPLPPASVDVGPAALGCMLAEAVAADLDSPPFDKAMMDGYAIRSADAPGTLRVIEEVLAGQTPRKSIGPGEACRIMTGAPMPAGADAVVMVERTRLSGSDVVVSGDITPGKNILPRGREMKAGETIFAAGRRLRPDEIGVLAGLGRSSVKVHPRPTVGVVSTGDEIVEVWEKPGPGQIRNSNGRLLLAQVARAGATPRSLGIARDNEPHLRQMLTQAFESDIVVLSGGVSAGKVDLVPAVLGSMGVKPLIHKVRMKPGKPLFFGVRPRSGKSDTLVFGLPGNPVSSLVCFELFARPAIERLMGKTNDSCWIKARLATNFSYPTDRPTYHPARLTLGDAGFDVRPVPWFGSADMRGVAEGNAFVLLAEGDGGHREGDRLDVLLVDDI